MDDDSVSFPWLAASLASPAEAPSDWHLLAGERLRLRRNGLMQVCDTIVQQADLEAVRQAAPGDDEELDLRFAGQRRRFRVHQFTTRGRRAAVLRHVPTTPPSLESIVGVPPAFIDAIRKPDGLFLVGGATNSGKSTTLAAVLDRINRQGDSVIYTAEHPIEFEHVAHGSSMVYQTAFSRDFTDWRAALSAALRKDPDVIALGELRDPETIYTALLAASTGHQIFATVHGGDAATILERIITAFPFSDRPTICALLGSVLRAVLAQRLVRSVDGKRVAAFELLTATQGVRVTIRDNQVHQIRSTIASGSADGMQNFDTHIERLLARKIITPEEARNHHSRPNDLKY